MRIYRPFLASVIALSVGSCTDDPVDLGEVAQGVEVPARWVEASTITLPNGDVADVYSPVVRAPQAPAFEDAFPVVVYLQGGLTARGNYRAFGTALAEQGFVVVVPDHLRAFGPPGTPPAPFTEANVIGAATAAVVALDADPSSPLYHVADPSRVGVAGHSFGGVVTLHTVGGACTPPFCTPPFALPPEVGAVALYGTHNMAGPSVLDIDTHGVAVALLRGDLDGRVSMAAVESTYGVLDDARALITVHGANHFGVTDTAAPVGTNPDPSAPTLDQETSTRAIATWTGHWFRDQLGGDHQAHAWLHAVGGSPDGVVTVDAIE